MAEVVAVTDATFESVVLKSPRPVLVDYWADWCAPCRQIAPIIEELARQYGDRVTFAKLDTNTNANTAVAQGILALPTLQLFVGGTVVKSLTGAKSKAALIKSIEEYL